MSNVDTTPLEAPPPATPPADDKPPTQRLRRRPQRWWANPPVLAAGALALLVLELAAFAFLGLLWWAAANIAAVFVLFSGALAWRRKGRGGLLDRLLPSRSTRRVRAGRGGVRTGGVGGGRWPGLRSRRGGRAGAAAGSAGRAGRVASLRSRLPRALGGTRGRSAAGTRSASAPGVRSRKFPRMFGGSRSSRATGTSAGSSGRRRFGLGGKFGSAGRKNRAGSSGPTSAGSSGRKSQGRRGPFRRRTSPTSASGTGGSSRGGGRKQPPPGRRRGGNVNPLNWGRRTGRTAGNETPVGAPDGITDTPPSGTRPAGTKPSPRPRPDNTSPTPPHRPQAGTTPPQKAPSHRHAGGKNMTDTTDTAIPYSDDQSLQRYGANLAAVEAAAADVRRLYAEAEAARSRYAQAVGKIKAQGETDLPLSTRVQAEVESIHQRATAANTADEWGRIEADAATLPGHYGREHETDEDRLHAPRKSHAAEMRADVTAAAQDN